MNTYLTAGVYFETWQAEPRRDLPTGVPGFLGFAKQAQDSQGTESPWGAPKPYTRWAQFEETLAQYPQLAHGLTKHAVKGFFANGGRLCYVSMIEPAEGGPSSDAVAKGLEAFTANDDVDLICAPDIMQLESHMIEELQAVVLKSCDDYGRSFAILDSELGADTNEVQNQRWNLRGNNGALYYPWIKIPDGPPATRGLIPPCGHVAAIYTRSDERVGVHKAPANEALVDVIDLERPIDVTIQDQLNPIGVNCLRAFPGRGIRVWGARTLSTSSFWTYVNVRRIFLTTARWIDRNMAGYVFEPHTPDLWARITRDLTAYFTDLWRSGALAGSAPDEAFFVKCNAETNPDEDRDQGRVVIEIGLAPTTPHEFIVVRIIQLTSGINMEAPGRLES